MAAPSTHSDELPQVPAVASVHRKAVDPAARSGKKLYEGMSASSVGLEMGIAVILGTLAGLWADSHFGTSPALMLVGIGIGLAAGFRGLLRAVAKEDRRGARDAAERAAAEAEAARREDAP